MSGREEGEGLRFFHGCLSGLVFTATIVATIVGLYLISR